MSYFRTSPYGVQQQFAVSAQFRELVMGHLHALRDHENALAYRRTFQYLLFSNFSDKMEEEGYDGPNRIVIPYQTVAGFFGVHPKALGFSAGKPLRDFSHDVVQLDVRGSRYTEGRARSVALRLPPQIEQALIEELERTDPMKEVWFVSGEAVTRRSRQKASREYEDYQREIAATMPLSHPAYHLQKHLTEQSQGCFNRVLRNNLPRVKEAVLAMPDATEKQRKSRNHNLQEIYGLNNYRQQCYVHVQSSSRLFAVGPSPNHLSREFRRMLFAGETEVDLRACQLAIVARLWEVSLLQDLLETGQSIWIFFSDFLGIPIELCKPIMKTTIYSIVFGALTYNAHRTMIFGSEKEAGIGKEATLRFFNHPIIGALLEARTRQLELIGRNGGAVDAFGNWISTKDGSAQQRRSVLAAVVQSYETLLMLPMLPVIKSSKQIIILSHLHDGMTMRLSDPSRKAKQIRDLQAAVSRKAKELGMATELEVAEGRGDTGGHTGRRKVTSYLGS